MHNKLTAPERLIVAVDFSPEMLYPLSPGQDNCRNRQRNKILNFVDDLAGTGVVIKLETDLRALGFDMIQQVHDRGLKFFADEKLYGNRETLARDGLFLKEARPEFVTVVCSTGIEAMQALKAALPDTEVLGVTVLTSHDETDTRHMYQATVKSSVSMLARLADRAGIDGLICAPAEIAAIKLDLCRPMTFNTPNIRSLGTIIENDDQNRDRAMTPRQAIKAGATRIIVGRPILNPPLGISSREAALRIIEEIEIAMTELA